MRPGEKLFEELSVAEEKADKTRHPKIFVGKQRPAAWDSLLRHLNELHKLSDGSSEEEIRKKLKELVPEFIVPKSKSAEPEVQSQSQAPVILFRRP
ncbi:MAG: hypothetical protein QM765_27265 [Myxococcales bacterium]